MELVKNLKAKLLLLTGVFRLEISEDTTEQNDKGLWNSQFEITAYLITEE